MKVKLILIIFEQTQIELMAKIDLEKSKNEDAMRLLVSQMEGRLKLISEGGGRKKELTVLR